MSLLTENAQWIVWTEGDMMFACKCGGTIWLKARLTKYTGKGHYISFRMIDEFIYPGWVGTRTQKHHQALHLQG
jgi:hypothetical protein